MRHRLPADCAVDGKVSLDCCAAASERAYIGMATNLRTLAVVVSRGRYI